MTLSGITSTVYRIEGQGVCGWILFDDSTDEEKARKYLGEWRKIRPDLKFRLKVVTITATETILEEDK